LNIFEAERELFHEPLLYPFERCETRPAGNPTASGVRVTRCRFTPEPLQFRALTGAAPTRDGDQRAGFECTPCANSFVYLTSGF